MTPDQKKQAEDTAKDIEVLLKWKTQGGNVWKHIARDIIAVPKERKFFCGKKLNDLSKAFR